VSKAQALVPGVQILLPNSAADLASLERLGLWLLERVAPIVALDPPARAAMADSWAAAHALALYRANPLFLQPLGAAASESASGWLRADAGPAR